MAKVRLVDSAAHPVRLAFAQHLFEAGTVAGEGKPAFSLTAIIPKDHPVHAELTAAEEAVAKEKWGEKAPAILKAIRADGKRGPVVKDGSSKSEYSGFEGNDFVSMRSEKRPNVYHRDGSSLTEADGVVYSGCYAHVMVEVWAQDNSYGKRINTQVTGVMFNRDGDSFGGGAPPAPADDFADLSAADEGDAGLLG
jgi:hypothetical protein